MKNLLLKISLFIFLCCNLQAQDFNFGSPLADTYVVSSSFGYRKAVMGGFEDGLHRGVDIVPDSIVKNKNANVKVIATASGVAYVVYPPPGAISKSGKRFTGHPIFGGLVILYHGNGIYSLYGHLKEIWITTGDLIKIGQPLGLVGSTGQSTGPHLHFEIDFDPTVLLTKAIVQVPEYPVFILKNPYAYQK